MNALNRLGEDKKKFEIVKLRKSGPGVYIVTMPRALLEHAGLTPDERVLLTATRGKITIESEEARLQ